MQPNSELSTFPEGWRFQLPTIYLFKFIAGAKSSPQFSMRDRKYKAHLSKPHFCEECLLPFGWSWILAKRQPLASGAFASHSAECKRSSSSNPSFNLHMLDGSLPSTAVQEGCMRRACSIHMTGGGLAGSYFSCCYKEAFVSYSVMNCSQTEDSFGFYFFCDYQLDQFPFYFQNAKASYVL